MREPNPRVEQHGRLHLSSEFHLSIRSTMLGPWPGGLMASMPLISDQPIRPSARPREVRHIWHSVASRRQPPQITDKSASSPSQIKDAPALPRAKQLIRTETRNREGSYVGRQRPILNNLLTVENRKELKKLLLSETVKRLSRPLAGDIVISVEKHLRAWV